MRSTWPKCHRADPGLPERPGRRQAAVEVAGDKIDEVFIGSCMTNIGHFRAAGKVLDGKSDIPTRLWIAPPTKMDALILTKAITASSARLAPAWKCRAARCAWATRRRSAGFHRDLHLHPQLPEPPGHRHPRVSRLRRAQYDVALAGRIVTVPEYMEQIKLVNAMGCRRLSLHELRPDSGVRQWRKRSRCTPAPESALLIVSSKRTSPPGWRCTMTGLGSVGSGAHRTRIPPLHLDCGILAHGFARALSPTGGHDFIVAYSRRGPRRLPSCGTTRRRAETAAHPVDHVFPRLPVRQWVLCSSACAITSMTPDLQTAVLHSVLRCIEQGAAAWSGGGGRPGTPGAIVVHPPLRRTAQCPPHYHAVVIDGVFSEKMPRACILRKRLTPGCRAATSGDDPPADRRPLRPAWPAGAGRWQALCACEHGGGFSFDAGASRPTTGKGLERLLRYCARARPLLRNGCARSTRNISSARAPNRSGWAVSSRYRTPLEFMDRLAALIPPPRRHRHRCYGVLAPNSPLRPAVTAWRRRPSPAGRGRNRGRGKSCQPGGRGCVGNAAGAHLRSVP